MHSSLLPVSHLLALSLALSAQQPDAVGTPQAEGAQPVSIAANTALRPDGPGRLLGAGAHYEVSFSKSSMRFLPVLGSSVAEAQHLQLQPLQVTRSGKPVLKATHATEPSLHGRTATYSHGPGISERYDVNLEHLELSWLFEERPEGHGDLVVEYALNTSLPDPVPSEDGGLRFALANGSGVAIGGVTGIDATGATVRGELQWSQGRLQMSLPAAFVDAAVYPMVLDPTLGARFGINTSTITDYEPDVAYDKSHDNYLVVWRRVYASQASRIRGQLVNGDGTLSGPTLLFSSSSSVGRPRVANHESVNRFGVVWEDSVTGFSAISMLSVNGLDGATGGLATIAFGPANSFRTPDIAGYTNGTLGGTAYVVVYEDNETNTIQARRVTEDVYGTLGPTSSVVLYSDTGGIGASYTDPAIARAAVEGDDLLVVVRRQSGVGPTQGVRAKVMPYAGSSPGASISLFNQTNTDVRVPDVDGYYGRWVVAWEQAPVSSSNRSVVCTGVTLAAGGGSLSSNGLTTIGGGSTSLRAHSPSVSYGLATTWVGYHRQSGQSFTLAARPLDSASVVTCGNTIQYAGAVQRRIVAGSKLSGGDTLSDESLLVWSQNGDIEGVRLINHFNSGAIGTIGPGCGAGGSQSFSHNPSIGSNGFACSVTGLSNSALISVFNFAPVTGAISCGPCQWTPFAVTITVPVASGAATVSFPIPCVASLPGSAFETQWTTVDFNEAPCWSLPALVLSDRKVLTIGY